MDRTKRNVKLKLREIIDELDPELLRAFVVQYATHDKGFEMAVKAHFISNIRESADEREKYKRLLEEMIKPKNAYSKITVSQKKMISVVFQDLVLQLNDLLVTDNYTEAYFLSKESLDKIAYLQNRYDVKDVTIESCRVQMLKGLELVLEEELAPVFRKNMETELIELASRSYFIPRDYNLIEVLNAKNVLTESDKKNLISDLMGKIDKKSKDLSILKTILQLSHPFPKMASKVLLEFNHDRIFEAVKSLIEDGKFGIVDFYIANPEIEFKYNREVLTVLKHIERDDHTALNKELSTFPMDNYNVLDLKLVCDALPDLYLRKEADKLTEWMRSLPFNLSSGLFARANRNEELIAMLEEKNDVEWLKVYDKLLIDRSYKKQVQQLYNKITENYIRNHIGKKSREYLERIQKHLSLIDEYAIYEKMYERISRQFDHRISLNG